MGIVESITRLLASWPVPQVGPLTPEDKWNALRQTGSGGTSAFLWIAMLAAACAIAVCLTVLHFLRLRQQRKLALTELRAAVDRAGLGADHKRVLTWIAVLSGAKPLDSVLTTPPAFERGTDALLGGDRATEIARHLGSPPAVIVRELREKLELGPPRAGRALLAHMLTGIPQASNVTVSRSASPREFDATVRETSQPTFDIALEPHQTIECDAGEVWTISRADQGVVCNFDAKVLKREDGAVHLLAQGDAHYISRRRFARIPTYRAALVAQLPLVSPGDSLTQPEFAKATVLEIGGPGMLLQMDAEVPMGQRLLIVVQAAAQEVLQVVGVVRRVGPAAPGADGGEQQWSIAVELVGLTPQDLSHLVRHANKAARQAAARPMRSADTQSVEA